MTTQEALEWADKISSTVVDSGYCYPSEVVPTLAALVRRQDAEINALHSDGMTIYAMMNDERVEKLKAENTELHKRAGRTGEDGLNADTLRWLIDLLLGKIKELELAAIEAAKEA